MRCLAVAALGSLYLWQVSAPSLAQPFANSQRFPQTPQASWPQSHGPISAKPSSSLTDLRQLALTLVNRDRRQQGLSPVTTNTLLDQVAQAHAEDMIRQGYFSHYAPNGSTPMERVRQAGGTMIAGENIVNYQLGSIQPSRHELVSTFQDLFIKSTSHRKIMMRSHYSQFGYGFAAAPNGRIVAVQMFGTPN